MASTRNKRFLITLRLYSEAFHEGVLSYCIEHGHEVTLLQSENLDEVALGQYDGVVGGTPDDSAHPILRYLADAGIPVVEYSYSHPDRNDWCRLPLDAALSGRMAADYLLRRPVASFAFACQRSGGTELLREQQFRAFLKKGLNGRPCSKFDYNETPCTAAEAERRLADFLTGLARPAGVFSSTDVFAGRICDVARRAGLKIPEDLYVICNGNRELITRLAPVPITSIDIDYVAWGREAARMLDEFSSGKIPPGTQRLFAPRGVIERASTGGAAGGDPLTGRAIALMRSQVRDPLNLPELSERLGVSPATLKRAFTASFGTGVAEYYLRLRIETAKGLIASGEKVTSVARECGFASTGSFRKAFSKITGVTPGSFVSQTT